MKTIDLPGAEGANFKKIANQALYDTVVNKAPEEAKKLLEMITKQ